MQAGNPAMNAAAPFALRRSFDWKWVVIGLCVVFTIYIAVVPLAFLLWQSFFTPQTASKAAEFTLGNYTSAYGSSETLRLFWNSVQFALGASLFAFVLGTALAWMNERTNTPFKTLFFALSIIPLIIPGFCLPSRGSCSAAPRSASSTSRCRTGSGWKSPCSTSIRCGG